MNQSHNTSREPVLLHSEYLLCTGANLLLQNKRFSCPESGCEICSQIQSLGVGPDGGDLEHGQDRSLLDRY